MYGHSWSRNLDRADRQTGLPAVRSTALIKVISKSSPILDRVWAFHVRDSTPPNLYPISKFVS